MSTDKIYVAGHRGMVGSAIVRGLKSRGVDECQIVCRSHAELDLTDQAAVRAFFDSERPTQVYLAAAKVGGIFANNTYPADFIYKNLMIEANVIEAAFRSGVRQLLFLGSSCIYPKLVDQPMREDALLTDTLEPTNEPYAVAKIAGIKLCESFNRQYGESHGIDYRSVMPTNLYGPGDNYHLQNSHVIPALIRKFHLAKLAAEGRHEEIAQDEQVYGAIPDDLRVSMQLGSPATEDSQNPAIGDIAAGQPPRVIIWGSGTPMREFLHVDDMAAACIHVMNLDQQTYQEHTLPMLSHINVGYGEDVTIRELTTIVGKVVGFEGAIEFDADKPDGTPRKLMDSDRLLKLGWSPTISLEQGLADAYRDYIEKLS